MSVFPKPSPTPPPNNTLDVDVTGNTRMTMSTQLQPLMHSNMVEEGIRDIAPSSSEISLPAEPVNIPKRHANQH